MNIISQLLLLSFAFAVLYVVIVFQVVALSRLYQSRGWLILATAFIGAGAMQVWRLIRFPLAMMQAQVRGTLPERLSMEQWLTIGVGFAIVTVLIIGFDRLRRDLRTLGM